MRRVVPLVTAKFFNGDEGQIVIGLDVVVGKLVTVEDEYVTEFDSDEVLAVRNWYVSEWSLYTLINARRNKEKPAMRPGNFLQLERDFTTPAGTLIPKGSLCRIMFPPKVSGYGLAPSTVRVCVKDEYVTIPCHMLTTTWNPMSPQDAEMSVARKWNGKRPVGEDVVRLYSPLLVLDESYIDMARQASL